MNENKYNLQDRTTDFGKRIINLCKLYKNNKISNRIVDQLVRSGTSVGANYMEAVNGSSKKDFKNKLFLCKKEAQETKYWLTMLKELETNDEIDALSNECHQLNLIFQKSIQTLEINSVKVDT
jgi:four helix bundle protein